jgi:hypothetical protein
MWARVSVPRFVPTPKKFSVITALRTGNSAQTKPTPWAVTNSQATRATRNVTLMTYQRAASARKWVQRLNSLSPLIRRHWANEASPSKFFKFKTKLKPSAPALMTPTAHPASPPPPRKFSWSRWVRMLVHTLWRARGRHPGPSNRNSSSPMQK